MTSSCFNSLGRDELTQILELELEKVRKRLAERDIHFELDTRARPAAREGI